MKVLNYVIFSTIILLLPEVQEFSSVLFCILSVTSETKFHTHREQIKPCFYTYIFICRFIGIRREDRIF